MPLIHNNKISYEHKSSDIYWLRSLLFLEHIRRKDITKQKNTFKIMMTKFTHAMTNFVFLQITVLSLTAERLPLTWFCAQGTQKDVQRPCTCQMQYTNVGQCARYKLFTGEVYQAACQYHMCNLMYLSSFQFSYQDRKTVSMLTNNVWESVTIQATHLIIDVLFTYIHVCILVDIICIMYTNSLYLEFYHEPNSPLFEKNILKHIS